jgi:5-formyltetrahydrofolate cyclo-ligase
MSGTDKQDLRDELLQERRALTPAAIDAARAAVRAAVLARQAAHGWTTVAAYRPLRTEPGSLELLDELIARGVRVLVPVTLPDRDLDWVQLPGDRPLTVDAISSADAVLVPALAVSFIGERLGRGGGSYDRALARVRPGAATAALVYDSEVLAHVPTDPWDVRVSACVTPGGGWRELG